MKRAKWVITLVLECNSEFEDIEVSKQMRQILHGDMASKDFYESPVGSGYTMTSPMKVAEVEG